MKWRCKWKRCAKAQLPSLCNWASRCWLPDRLNCSDCWRRVWACLPLTFVVRDLQFSRWKKKKKEKPLKKSSCEFFGLPLVGVLPLCSSEFFLSDPPQAQERWLFCVKLHDCKAGLSLSVKQKDVSWLKLAWQLQFKFPNLLWTVKLKSVFCWGDWMWLGCIWLLICNGSFRMQLIGTCWNVLIIPGI